MQNLSFNLMCSLLVTMYSIHAGVRPADAASASKNMSLSTTLNVKSFGATGDGTTKDTAALQRAIDAASAAGGGTVYFPAGKFLTGTLVLKSLVTLHLEAGATVLGSTDLEDYPELTPKFRSWSESYVSRSIIYGEGLHDIAIVGRGTIDGQGDNEVWKKRRDEEGRPAPGQVKTEDKGALKRSAEVRPRKRPYNIRITSCQNVLIEGITLRNSAMWMQHYMDCENVVVRGITVDNRVINNNDGIDIDSCKNVRISNCIIYSIDDAICLKNTGNRLTENVVVTNCITSNQTNGFKLGTEAFVGFKNVAVSNCAMYDCGMAAVSLSIVDGATMDGVTVNNLALHNVDTPVFIRLGDRGRAFAGDPKPPIGTLRNINISNIVASGNDSHPGSMVGASIHGLPGHPVENVSLSNFRLIYHGGGTQEEADRVLPELPGDYPEHSMFGHLPAYGFYCRHVVGLTMENIEVSTHKPDMRPALRCEDVQNLRIRNFQAMPPDGGNPAIVLRDVRTALLTGCVASTDTNVWLNLRDKVSGISVLANDLSAARKAFDLAGGLDPAVLFEQANRLPK